MKETASYKQELVELDVQLQNLQADRQNLQSQTNEETLNQLLVTLAAHPRNITELQKEIDTKTTLITNYKQQLVELEVQLQNLQAARQNLQSQTNEETLNQLLVSLAAQPRNITELQKEIDTKTTLITNSKQQLVELEAQLQNL